MPFLGEIFYMCDVLKEIYFKVYNESFNYDELSHRIKMQKSVYLLENMGISVGDYSFSWNKYGPYSLQLDSEAKRCANEEEIAVAFSEDAINVFAKISEIINQVMEYSVEKWVECITSLHYMKHILRIQEDNLLEELAEKKPYLNSVEANKKALEIANGISVG